MYQSRPIAFERGWVLKKMWRQEGTDCLHQFKGILIVLVKDFQYSWRYKVLFERNRPRYRPLTAGFLLWCYGTYHGVRSDSVRLLIRLDRFELIQVGQNTRDTRYLTDDAEFFRCRWIHEVKHDVNLIPPSMTVGVEVYWNH